MKRLSSFLAMLFVVTTLTSCAQDEAILMPENSFIQSELNNNVAALDAKKTLKEPSVIKGKTIYDSRKNSKVKKNYTFTRPTAIFYADLWTNSDTKSFSDNVKSFMDKYVSNQDIAYYDIVVNDRDSDLVNVNVYGGESKFVQEKLMQDLNFYLGQRSKFDAKYMKMYEDKQWTKL